MTTYNLREVSCLAMALCDGCILAAQHHSDRTPNDITSTQYNGIGPRNLNTC
jgi:hypothetical protein